MLRMGEIATASIPKSQLVNLLQVPGGSESQQVMLQVRFAEVNRQALTEAGLSLFLTRQRFLGRSTTQQFSAPEFESEAGEALVVCCALSSRAPGSRVSRNRISSRITARRRASSPGESSPFRS
jgi:Flp pilus assembly secretin CpaC